MKTIRKYRVIPFGSSDLPFGKVLLLAQQGGQVYAWVEVTLEGPNQIEVGRREVFTKPTGADAMPGQTHLASCITETGLVWHLYEGAAR